MKRIAIITGLTAAAVILAGCGGSHPDAAACKKAMRAEYAAALANGTKGTEPGACKGLPAAQIRQFAVQIISGH